jgi:hypothetical protein
MTVNSNHKKTRLALLWMNLSHEPFMVVYVLLPFIIRKDLAASLLQLSILTALRPVLPVFSFYWSANLSKHRLRANLIGAWVLARLPFLFIPWIPDVWYLIFCCGVYELFNKSGIPALIEILNINLPKAAREKTYSFYFVLSFLESIVLGLLMGGVLDLYPFAWQWICGGAALVGLSSIFVQLRVPIPVEVFPVRERVGWGIRVIKPWKEAFHLLKTHREFLHFQCGFMIGGFSLMLMAPSLALFCADQLQLSHGTMVTGRSILMGIGIVASAAFWRSALAGTPVIQLTQWVLVGFAIYPLAMVLASLHVGWFYLAYVIYGVAQAGSHLLWNLSGTLFGDQRDSACFSRVNILMLGLRGAVAPALGGILCTLVGPVMTLLLGAVLCFVGVGYALNKREAMVSKHVALRDDPDRS